MVQRLILVILLPVLLSVPLPAQFRMSLGPIQNYNDQYDGRNHWPNNGRSIDLDTTRLAWCSDNNNYSTGNDGYGPNSVFFPQGRNAFIFRLSDYTTNAAGALMTLVNSFDDYGTGTQINTGGWTDGFSWKTGGMDCQSGRMYVTPVRQDPGSFQGNNPSIIWSDNLGVTWCNSQHTNHTTGACTITPSATGDAPAPGAAMWDPSTDIYNIHLIQFGKDGVSSTVVENNDVWKYIIVENGRTQHLYTGRVRITDLPKLDPTLFQWYKGGSCTADTSWGDVTTKVYTEPTGTVNVSMSGGPWYLPLYHSYVMFVWQGATTLQFYKSPSICGPWTFLLDAPQDKTVHESWYWPTLKTQIGSSSILLTFAATSANRDNSFPPNNQYAVHYRMAEFAPILGIQAPTAFHAPATFH